MGDRATTKKKQTYAKDNHLPGGRCVQRDRAASALGGGENIVVDGQVPRECVGSGDGAARRCRDMLLMTRRHFPQFIKGSSSRRIKDN